MIVDTSVVRSWIFEKNEEAEKIRKLFESGNLEVKAPSIVKFDICGMLLRMDMPENDLARLVKLVLDYLDYLLVDVSNDQMSEAVKFSRRYGVSLSAAASLVLARTLGDLYVTADADVSGKLKRSGYPVFHVSEVV